VYVYYLLVDMLNAFYDAIYTTKDSMSMCSYIVA